MRRGERRQPATVWPRHFLLKSAEYGLGHGGANGHYFSKFGNSIWSYRVVSVGSSVQRGVVCGSHHWNARRNEALIYDDGASVVWLEVAG